MWIGNDKRKMSGVLWDRNKKGKSYNQKDSSANRDIFALFFVNVNSLVFRLFPRCFWNCNQNLKYYLFCLYFYKEIYGLKNCPIQLYTSKKRVYGVL